MILTPRLDPVVRFLVIASMACVLLSTNVGAQTVHVVDADNGPGTDATTITQGVAAATSGDILLIREGTYDEFVTIDGKGLTLLADDGAAVAVGAFEILNIAADDFVAIRGLEVTGADPAFFYSLTTSQCAGPVWIEDLTVSAPPATAFGLGALSVVECASVAFDGCVFQPGPLVNWNNTQTLLGLRVIRSSAYFFDSSLTGLPGSSAPLGCPTPGDPGLYVEDGYVWLYGCTVIGGDGGSSTSANSKNGERGGSGIATKGATTEINRLDTSIVGGVGGSASSHPSSAPGANGNPFFGPGTLVDILGTSRSHSIDSPFRPGESVVGTFLGESDELVDLWLSARPGFGREFRVVDGPFVLDIPLTRAFSLVLDPSGALVVASSAFDPAPNEAIVIFAQALHAGSTGLVLGPPTMVTFLNGSL